MVGSSLISGNAQCISLALSAADCPKGTEREGLIIDKQTGAMIKNKKKRRKKNKNKTTQTQRDTSLSITA